MDIDCGLLIISFHSNTNTYGGMSLIAVSWAIDVIKNMTHNANGGSITVTGNTDAGITLTVNNEPQVKAGDVIRYRISYIRNYDG